MQGFQDPGLWAKELRTSSPKKKNQGNLQGLQELLHSFLASRHELYQQEHGLHDSTIFKDCIPSSCCKLLP